MLQHALNALMTPVQPPGRSERLIYRPKHEIEHRREGAMKPADRVIEADGVIGNALRHPGMGELH